MDNASDERSIERKRNSATSDARLCDRVLRALMSSAEGRRYIWLELTSAKVFEQTLVLAAEGYAATAFNEGRRSLGLKLLADVCRLDPLAYLTMTRENSKQEIEDERSTDD